MTQIFIWTNFCNYLQIIQATQPQPVRAMWSHNTWSAPKSAPAVAQQPVSSMQRVTSAPTSAAIDTTYQAGDKVKHKVFGSGTVQRVYRDEASGNDKIDIVFSEKGLKTLLLTYAKLERE